MITLLLSFIFATPINSQRGSHFDAADFHVFILRLSLPRSPLLERRATLLERLRPDRRRQRWLIPRPKSRPRPRPRQRRCQDRCHRLFQSWRARRATESNRADDAIYPATME